MSEETPGIDEPKSPFDVPDDGEAPSAPLDESPFEVQPLDAEERSGDRDGFERLEAEKPADIASAGVHPDESPFVLQAIEGLPYEEGSEEARAIRDVIEQADLERSDASRISASVDGA